MDSQDKTKLDSATNKAGKLKSDNSAVQRKEIPLKAAFIIVILAILATWGIVKLLPVPTEPVRITALRERNEKSRKDDLYLTGVYVGEKQVELQTATEEKWFWQRNYYVWRRETDPQRPVNLSDSFTLSIPVGKERRIEFFTNTAKGFVLVEYGGDSIILDCYSEGDGHVNAYIQDTPQKQIVSQALSQIAISIAIYALLLAIMTWIYYGLPIRYRWEKPSNDTVTLRSNGMERSRAISVTTRRKNERIVTYRRIDWNQVGSKVIEHWDTFSLLTLSLGTLLMVAKFYPCNDNYYFDHIITAGALVSPSLKDTFIGSSGIDLTALMSYFYYRIAPFGREWFFLLPTVYISISVFLIGKSVSRFVGKTEGLVTALFALTSATFLEYGHDLRSYSFTILSTMLLVFSYMDLRQNTATKGRWIRFVLCMLIAVYGHLYSCILVFGIFVFDVYYNRKKLSGLKAVLRIILPYFCIAILFLPFIISHMAQWLGLVNIWGSSATWHYDLTLSFVRELFYRLCGRNYICVCLYLFAILQTVYRMIRREALKKENIIWTFALYLSLFYCAALFGWALTHPENTLLNYRYFPHILPLMIISEASGAVSLVRGFIRFLNKDKSNTITTVSSSVLIMIIAVFIMQSVYIVSARQNTASGWLLAPEQIITDKEVYHQTSCVVIRVNSRYGNEEKAYLEYMMYHKGEKDPVNLALYYNNKDLSEISKYSRLYVFDPSTALINALTDLGYTSVKTASKLTILVK